MSSGFGGCKVKQSVRIIPKKRSVRSLDIEPRAGGVGCQFRSVLTLCGGDSRCVTACVVDPHLVGEYVCAFAQTVDENPGFRIEVLAIKTYTLTPYRLRQLIGRLKTSRALVGDGKIIYIASGFDSENHLHAVTVVELCHFLP